MGLRQWNKENPSVPTVLCGKSQVEKYFQLVISCCSAKVRSVLVGSETLFFKGVMPSLVEKMQPWTQTHSFIPASLLRRSWSSSSAASSTPLTSSSSTTSLLSTGSSACGSAGSSSDSGLSVVMKNGSGTNGTTRVGGGTGSPSPSSSGGNNRSIFGKIRGGGEGSGVSNNNNATSSSNNNSGGPRPKRKTPILSTCMSNWVKFDHDCKKPLPCTECESNQERNRKVLFNSGGNMLISTGKGKNHHHRHSSHFFSSHNRNSHHNHHPGSISEPTSPIDLCGTSTSSHNNPAFSGEVVSWENAKNASSFKIVINVPCLDMNLFQNDNIQVEIVCNKNKLASPKDFEIVQRNRTELRCSGWYWEGIDSEASMEILESAQPGAFIIRDSTDPRFLYSLSLQTERGPTSVRLTYRNGKFSLDADEKLAELLPKFNSVIRLIEHYVNGGTKVGKQVWIDPKGNMHSTVKLTKPVRKDVGSLQHLARVAINRHNLLTNNNNTSCSSASSSIISGPSTSTSSVNNNVSNKTMMTTSPPPVPNNSSCANNNNNAITPSTSATTITTTSPVDDLSKLPMSLQSYMVAYPYNL